MWLLFAVLGGALFTTIAVASKKKSAGFTKVKGAPPALQLKLASLATALKASQKLALESDVRVTGPVLSEIYNYARRAMWGHVGEAAAVDSLNAVMAGERPLRGYWQSLRAHCPGLEPLAPASVAFIPHEQQRACVRGYIEQLGPFTAWEKSLFLWDYVWRFAKLGFNPRQLPLADDDLQEVVHIINEAILSEIDPVRAPDPSVSARLKAITDRCEQVIYWPICGDMEGCQMHRNNNLGELQALQASYQGERLIAEIASLTGRIIASRTRVYEPGLPTDFGEFFVEVALPAFLSGVDLALEIWGAIQGDEFEWEYPANVYTEEQAGQVNQLIASAKAARDSAETQQAKAD